MEKHNFTFKVIENAMKFKEVKVRISCQALEHYLTINFIFVKLPIQYSENHKMPVLQKQSI